MNLVNIRVAASRDGILARAVAGDPPFVRLREEGHPQAMEATIDWIQEHQTELRSTTK